MFSVEPVVDVLLRITLANPCQNIICVVTHPSCENDDFVVLRHFGYELFSVRSHAEKSALLIIVD